MISYLATYLYCILLFIYLLLIVISSVFDGPQLGKNFIYLSTILLLPFFDYLFELLKKDYAHNKSDIDSTQLSKGLLLIFVMIFLLFQGMDKYNSMLIGFLIAGILWGTGSRIAFVGALALFVYVFLYIIIGNNPIAETLSIYAYYLLVIGVALQVREGFCKGNTISNTLEHE